MKNKIIIIAVAIVAIGGAYLLLNSDGVKNINSDKASTGDSLSVSGTYSFDANLSKIVWEGKKTFIKDWTDTGSISVQSGYINIADNKVKDAKIIIDMNSIAASKTGAGKGEDMLSKHLKSGDFFDAVSFPTSEFSLTSVVPTSEKNIYSAKGDITIKGITKTIEFPITAYEKDGGIYLKADLALDRTQFNVKYGSKDFFKDLGDNTIDNEFKLKLELVAKK